LLDRAARILHRTLLTTRDEATMPFTMATLNILDHQARPTERFPLIVAGLAQAWPDIIALQEVAAGREQGERLAAALTAAAAQLGREGTYQYAQQTNLRRHDLTVGILTRHAILDHCWVDLQGQGRVAVAITTEIAGRRLAFASTHLFWEVGPAGEQARRYQAGVLADWVAVRFADVPTIVGGDFNATPDGITYAYLAERWASLYAERHGAEPAWTCPTPLAPEATGWQGTLDYLWRAPRTAPLRTLDARLFLDQPAPNDSTLYPSDHVGVLARVAFED
jgi:endonuclease/exonuclease/phosphatase family metal-dependent hydrolase